MSEESRFPRATRRKLSDGEKGLLRELLYIAGWPEEKATASESFLVANLSDGGMGSVRFFDPSVQEDSRRFGRRIAELEFADVDGATVIASLNVDQHDALFELDIWKTNFARLIAYPNSTRRRTE